MSKERLCIYVAGPFTAKDIDGILKNLDNAIQAGNAVVKRGHHPYIPHLNYYMTANASNPFFAGRSDIDEQNDRRWVDVDAPWVLLCDAIYIMPQAYEKPVGSYPCSECQASKIGRCGYHLTWKSKGAKHEYENAVARGTRVFWSIDDIPKAPEWEGTH